MADSKSFNGLSDSMVKYETWLEMKLILALGEVVFILWSRDLLELASAFQRRLECLDVESMFVSLIVVRKIS